MFAEFGKERDCAVVGWVGGIVTRYTAGEGQEGLHFAYILSSS